MPDLDLDALLDELGEETPVSEDVEVNDWEDEEPAAEVTEVLEVDERPNTPNIPKNEPPVTATSITDTNPDGIKYSEDFLETMDSTRSYIGDVLDIEAKMKELKDELKARKELAKEEGVKVGNAGKAIRELLKEAKETSDEAHGVAEVKRFIKENSALYAGVLEQTS